MIQKPDGYTDREPASELDLLSRIHGRFKGAGEVMPSAQRDIYLNLVKVLAQSTAKKYGFPKHINKSTIVDVGCGCGIGTNLLSREAQFAWGIDNNDESICYARQMFERPVQQNIYYTSQVTFDTIDILSDSREFMQFDFVACIEVIEHLPREKADDLLRALRRFVKKDKRGNWESGEDRTVVYLSTPNRLNPRLGKDTPINPHHCYEMTPSEAYTLFTRHFKAVTVLNKDFELRELNTEDSPLVYKLEMPL